MLVLHTKDFGEFAKAGNPVDIMPWLKYVMPGKVKKFLQLVNMVVSFRKRKVAEHLEMFQEHNLRDATDGFISAVKKGRKNGDFQELSDEQIYSSIEDIVGAGYDTMSTLIEWVIVCMTVFQNIQTKVQEEIDRVIGQRKPCVKDKGSLPYVEATILEIMRFSTISPLGLPHVAKKDTMLKHYFIPKGTVTFSNFYAVAHDARYWRTPENFDPRRFLTKNNEIDTDALGNVLTFGLGKRRCLGEFLAKAEIFIIFTTLLQQCTFQRVEGFTYNLSGGGGLTHEPSPYKVKVSRRY
ncbi:hypothetical protein KUTeg_005095 [Tegillarca granosa]|uniref:unspecific monooxygenase n=1 Tax=Tegillarca granosa TaxID=220873 RepID=A0ABQ9FKJ4_TEGGR|nr:hypothetical protein KUTeg_005095 [Tegillarca granosa]